MPPVSQPPTARAPADLRHPPLAATHPQVAPQPTIRRNLATGYSQRRPPIHGANLRCSPWIPVGAASRSAHHAARPLPPAHPAPRREPLAATTAHPGLQGPSPIKRTTPSRLIHTLPPTAAPYPHPAPHPNVDTPSRLNRVLQSSLVDDCCQDRHPRPAHRPTPSADPGSTIPPPPLPEETALLRAVPHQNTRHNALVVRGTRLQAELRSHHRARLAARPETPHAQPTIPPDSSSQPITLPEANPASSSASHPRRQHLTSFLSFSTRTLPPQPEDTVPPATARDEWHPYLSHPSIPPQPEPTAAHHRTCPSSTSSHPPPVLPARPANRSHRLPASTDPALLRVRPGRTSSQAVAAPAPRYPQAP